MFIETAKTQIKLRELFHEENCADTDCKDLADEGSRCWRRSNRLALLFLGKLMPTLSAEMFPLVRADERDKVAYYIRAELVCCDIHEKLEKAYDSGKYRPDIRPRDLAQVLGISYHAICRYGGWAAQLAQDGPEFDHREVTFPQGCQKPECDCHAD